MSFSSEFDSLALAELSTFSQNATAADVEAALVRSGMSGKRISLTDFAALISPIAAESTYLEALARQSHELTEKYFGRVMRFFAPLYVSNECINICKYCGFSRDNPILRVTLSVEQVATEARYLREQGFRHILLVAGEHPHFISDSYLRDCVARLHDDWPSIALEVGPLETEEYVPIVQAGAADLVVYL